VRVSGDPDKLEQLAGENGDMIRGIAERAKSHGLIAHRFYGSEGQIMVVDEWPDEQSFQSFFKENNETLGPMFQAAGVTSEPQPKFWRTLESHDEFGWGA
jgi:hypothetical protein